MTFGQNVILKTLCPKGARLKTDKLLEDLIVRYEARLQEGKIYLSEMKKASANYQTQFSINSFWRMVLKDLREISDKAKHEDHKKRQ